MREILGEEREAICQQAEQGILGECEIEVALTIIDAMADEMSFYDELRESLNEAIEADQALEYFRRLIPIWVAKQDQNLQWGSTPRSVVAHDPEKLFRKPSVSFAKVDRGTGEQAVSCGGSGGTHCGEVS